MCYSKLYNPYVSLNVHGTITAEVFDVPEFEVNNFSVPRNI